MRPPICALCSERFDPSEGGGQVRFADYKPLTDGMVGHPDGLEWFCGAHLIEAQSYSHQDSGEAIQEMWISLSSRGC